MIDVSTFLVFLFVLTMLGVFAAMYQHRYDAPDVNPFPQDEEESEEES